MSDPVRVGVIGCGKISGAYFSAAQKLANLEMVACADVFPDAAKSKAAEYGVPRVLTVDQLIADPDVEVVLNLTVPKAHADIAIRSLAAGKHTYAEKPLGVNRAEGLAILAAAKKANRLVGCAPDTFMGYGIQTARRAIDTGLIGQPVAFTAFMMCPGHESWHPSPEFYYEVGGGPMFDMGPYYLTALLNLLGPAKRLSALASIAIPVRTITSEPKKGKRVTVETPDHYCGSIEFENGAVGTIIQSFATRFAPVDGKHPIVIYGTEGTLQVPDPNAFNGTNLIRRNADADWTELPKVFDHEYGRSVGLADLADAIRTKRPFRANGEQAYAVLDLMQGFLDSSATGQTYLPTAPYHRPAPMPLGADYGVLA